MCSEPSINFLISNLTDLQSFIATISNSFKIIHSFFLDPFLCRNFLMFSHFILLLSFSLLYCYILRFFISAQLAPTFPTSNLLISQLHFQLGTMFRRLITEYVELFPVAECDKQYLSSIFEIIKNWTRYIGFLAF